MTSPPALIAVDIDGTLLSSDGTVLPGTRAEFARARAAGATIVLASGRPVAGLRRLVDRLELDAHGFVFTGANGAVSVDADSGEVLARHPMSLDLVRAIMTLATEHGIVPMLCDGEHLVVDRPDDPQVEIEAEGNGLIVRAVAELGALTVDDVTVDKVLLYAQPTTLGPFAEDFVARFGEATEHAFSAPFYFEATARGVDKGSALTDLAAARGLDPRDSVAFGDNGNDLPLLRAAGLGVAMANAIPAVLEAADRVTASHDDEGIAAILMDLFGGGEPAPPVPEPEGVEPLYALDLSEPAGAEPDETRGTTI